MVTGDDDTNPRQSKEVSIAMRATLGAVDLIQMLQGELELCRKRFSPRAQLAFSEGREFVEERLNHSWVYDNHYDLECQPGGEGILAPRHFA